MILRTVGSTPSGDNTPMLKMEIEEGKALAVPIENALDGEGVLSMWIKGESSNGTIIIRFCDDVFVQDVSTKWTRIHIKGVIDHTKPIYILGSENGYTFYIHKAQLESGNVVTGWTPNTYDDGSSLIITEKKVYIGTPEFEVNIDESDNGLTIGKNGASMNTLTVETDFSAPNVRYIQENISITTSNSKTLKTVVEDINEKHLIGAVEITLGEDVYENIVIKGLTGASLVIHGNEHSFVNSTISIRDCQNSITLDTLNVTSPVGNNCVYIENCSYVRIINGVYSGTYNSSTNATERCFYIRYGSNVYISRAELYDAKRLIHVDNSFLGCDNIKGSCSHDVSTNSLQFCYGNFSQICWNGTRPAGTSGCYACLTNPGDLTSLTVSEGQYTPQAPEFIMATNTFKPIAINGGSDYGATLYVGSEFVKGNQIYQGYYGGESKKHRIGCVWFNFNTATIGSGDEIISATIRVNRLSGSGSSKAVSVKIRPTIMTQYVSSKRTRADIYGSSTIPRDMVDSTEKILQAVSQTFSFAHPNDLKTVIQNGYALAFDPDDYSGGSYSSNYSKFSAKNIELNITYKHQINNA